MKKLFLIILLCLIEIKLSSANTNIIRFSGAPTHKNSIFKLYGTQLEKETKITLEFTTNNSLQGLKDLVDDKVDVAAITNGLEQFQSQFPEGSFKNLTVISVGGAKIKFIINKNNQLNKLTLEQLKNIFIGKIKNWAELGWENHPINIYYVSSKSGGITSVIEKDLLNDKVTSNATIIISASDIPEAINKDNYGISYITQSLINDNIKTIDTEKEFLLQMYFVVKGQPSKELIYLVDKILNIYKAIQTW